MQVLHGTWIPQHTEDYLQKGGFYLWVETDMLRSGKKQKNDHPRSLSKPQLAEFLTNELGIKKDFGHQKIDDDIFTKYFTLPGAEDQPLKSYQLMELSNDDPLENFEFQAWEISCYKAPSFQLFNTSPPAALQFTLSNFPRG